MSLLFNMHFCSGINKYFNFHKKALSVFFSFLLNMPIIHHLLDSGKKTRKLVVLLSFLLCLIIKYRKFPFPCILNVHTFCFLLVNFNFEQ